MASPQMVVRISANVEELRRNLAEGKASIEALGPSVEKLQSNWKKHSATLVQDANNITAAVNKVGASALTAGDSAQAIKKLEAAMAQLRTAGQPIPALMQQAADKLREMHPEIDKAGTKTSTFGDTVKKIGPMILAAFSIGAIKSFVGGLIDTADGLAKMSAQTGIGTDALQYLKEAANRGGNTLEEVTKSINKMQINLAGGDKGAMQAVKALGLSFDELRAMKPEDQFSTVAAAIAQVEDPADRAKLSMLMFGRTGTQIAGTLAVDMQSVRDSVTVMSEDSIQALDKAGDDLQRISTNIKSFLANQLVALHDWTRDATDGVIMTVMATEVLLKQHIASMYQSVADINIIPGVGSKLKEAANYWRDSAKESEEALAIFMRKTDEFSVSTEHAAAAARAGGRALLDLGTDARDTGDTVSKRAAPAVRDFTASVAKANDALEDAIRKQLYKNTEQGLRDMARAAEEADKQFGAMLKSMAPLKSSALDLGIMTLPTVTREMDEVAASASAAMGPLDSFFAGIKQGVSGLVQGLTGGKGLSGFFSNIGLGITNELGAILTGGMSTLINKAVAIAWEGAKKIAGYFKDLFSGASAEELAGREVVKNFESNIAAMMNERQKLEAGNDSWKQTVVVVRDAYLALGKTEEEALAAVKALWESSKGGADAVARAMGPIEAALAAVRQQSEQTGLSLDELRARGLSAAAAIESIGGGSSGVTDGPGLPGGERGVPGFANGTGGRFIDFGAGTPVILHGRERIVTEREAASGQGMSQTIVVQLDGQVIARAAARNLPRQLVLAGR